MKMTIVVPAFNEEGCIEGVLTRLVMGLRELSLDAEVLVVDDGSTDATAERAEAVSGVRVIRHPYNKGYGAAIKTGIGAASTEWCITFDADDQHSIEHIAALLPFCREPFRMVVGNRRKHHGPWMRKPGKLLLQWVANVLTRQRIPDLNSGLRAFHRPSFLRYQHLFPDGFSLSTTSTVCFFSEGLPVHYVPIAIRARQGRSTVRLHDGFRTMLLILRLIMLFSPLRIFLPATILFVVLAVADLVYEYSTIGDVMNSSSVALITLASLTFFFGLLADQVAAIRRELGARIGEHSHPRSS